MTLKILSAVVMALAIAAAAVLANAPADLPYHWVVAAVTMTLGGWALALADPNAAMRILRGPPELPPIPPKVKVDVTTHPEDPRP